MRIQAAAVVALLILLLLSIIGLQSARHRAEYAQQRERDALVQVGMLRNDLTIEAGKERIVTRFVDRVQIVREVGATIIRDVPRYVSIEADRACLVPVGFVRVHDAAAAGVPPTAEGAGDPDAPAAGVALSGVAATVADNYTTCHAIAAQLSALQAHVRLIEGGDGE